LALDNPLVDPNSEYATILSWIDIETTVIFIIEAIMKILSFGFACNGPSSYIKNIWNRLDFAIIILSLLSTSVLNQDFKAFKVLRVLRLIGRNEGLKIAVKSLFMGLPNILNVAVIMFLFFLIFGVIAVSQFKGRLFSCLNADAGQEVLHKWDCFNAGGVWVNDFYNFDDIANAILTLFVMSTTAGWTDVMNDSITSTDIDYVAGTKRNLFWNLFFIFFLIIGFFFFLNLFIGVVVTNFNTEKDKIGGNDLLTEKQREWIDLKLLVLRCAPIQKFKAPSNKFRLFFFKI
jgi:Ion transport protein